MKTVLLSTFVLLAGYGVYSSQNSIELSDLAIANVEALARYELPEVDIVCNGGEYGMCQYCHRYEIYDPLYGYGWAYKCIMTGDQEDWCPSSCNSDGGGSFPG